MYGGLAIRVWRTRDTCMADSRYVYGGLAIRQNAIGAGSKREWDGVNNESEGLGRGYEFWRRQY